MMNTFKRYALSDAVSLRTAVPSVFDGDHLCTVARAALLRLRAHESAVNEVNIFPVADHDTGTNMVATLEGACKAIKPSCMRHLGRAAAEIARGAFFSARGNSGIILSQWLSGFADAAAQKKVLDATGLAVALARAADSAQIAVADPCEGTILTASREMARTASAVRSTKLLLRLNAAVRACRRVVDESPRVLPVLRGAGVVDAGALGLLLIMEGALQCFIGRRHWSAHSQRLPAALTPGFPTGPQAGGWELIVDLRPDGGLDREVLLRTIEDLKGSSLQIAYFEGLFRIHVHVTDEKQEPLALIRSLGTIMRVRREALSTTSSGSAPARSTVKYL